MRYNENTALAGSQAQTAARPSGMHESTSQQFNRLCVANDTIAKLLARVRGAQPEPTNQVNKDSAMPSVMGILGETNMELSRLEAQLNELAEVIG